MPTIKKTIFRPVQMLFTGHTRPTALLYIGYIYGIGYLLIVTFADVCQDTHKFKVIVALSYLSIGIDSDRIYALLTKAKPE
jgi:hypothetical protein